MVTSDKNMRYQQNLAHRRIAFVVMSNAQWPALSDHMALVAAAVNDAKPGGYVEVEIPSA